MNLLKPIIARITNDKRMIEEVNKMSTDGEIFDLLSLTIDTKEIAHEFEHYYGVEFVYLNKTLVELDVMNKFDTKMLQSRGVLPYKFTKEDNTYYFALSDIFNDSLRKGIERSCQNIDAGAKFSFSPKEHIDMKYKDIAKDPLQGEVKNKATSTKVVTEPVLDDGSFNALEWVDGFLNTAIDIGASDIHIEPLEEGLQVRYRVDGVMTRKKVHKYSDGIISSIFVRLKVISGMDISEKRKAQDGRIDNYSHSGKTYDLRVSTVSTVFGEKAVLRLLDKSSKTLTFEELGFSDSDTSTTKNMLLNNNGIIYIAGATGSGKTTTLYSMIDVLNDDSVNMYTIENPVEKTVNNVNQIQIDELSGITYPSTLRALLRQDPDIIVVGEIRDQETAELSVRASLTGHLVLSTIHANSALDSIGRLMNMGIEPYLIVGSSLGFFSQRLVRRLCDHCKIKTETLTPSETAWLKKNENEYGIDSEFDSFYTATGCNHCTEGYRGRVAAVEIVALSEPLKALILEGASTIELKEQALKDGFKPMAIDGVEKARAGLTSIQELIRELN